MADLSVIKLPNGSSYNFKDSQALATAIFSGHELTLTKRGTGTQVVDLGEFDTINITDANVGNLVVTGAGRFTNGLYGNLTGNASTATTATTAGSFSSAQSIALTGDVTGSASSQAGWSITTTLKNSGVTADSYGPSANASPAHGGTFSVPYITVDAKGRITSASTKTITLPASGNTDTKVTQTAVTASSYTYWRPLIFGASNSSTEGFSPSTVTDQVYATNTLSVQPSTGTIRATTFKGALSGNATTATKATQDESGNNIKANYAASLSISGHTITLNNKNGESLGTVTVPDNDANTWRAIQVNGTEILAGNSSTALNLKAGTNVSITNSSGTVTIAATDTTYGVVSKTANGLAPQLPNETTTTKYLRQDGSWQVPPNDNTHHTAYLYAGAASGTANAATTNGNTHLLLVENSTFRSGVKLVPGSNMNITSDASGNVTFTSTDTTYSVVSAGTSTTTGGLMSQADKTKLNGIATGAEVNQNAFSNFTIGSTTIEADSKTDTLTFVAGNNVSLTPDATNDKITIAATDTTYSVVSAGTSTTDGGLMSQADKTKLNGIATGAEVNQNAFSNITVGSTTIQADGKTDTLTLVAGSNVTLTPDATNDKVTIASSYTNTIPSAYCTTAAGTAAKTASCTGYVLREHNYIQVIITNANSYNGAITLNINNTGAKSIYINGTASSSSNKTLPAGSYFVYYNGTSYYFSTTPEIFGYIRVSSRVSLSSDSTKKYLIGSSAKTGNQYLWTNSNDIYMEGDTLYSPKITTTDGNYAISIHNGSIDIIQSPDEMMQGDLFTLNSNILTLHVPEENIVDEYGQSFQQQHVETIKLNGGNSLIDMWNKTSGNKTISIDGSNGTITTNNKFLINNISEYNEVEITSQKNELQIPNPSWGKIVLRYLTGETDSSTHTNIYTPTDTITLDGSNGSGTFMGDIQIEKETSGDASVNFIAKSSSNLAEIRLSVSNAGNHGLYSTGYYNGSSFVDSPGWLLYRNTSNQTVINGQTVHNNNVLLQYANSSISVKDTTKGCTIRLHAASGGNHGVYSDGYWNGSSFVNDGRWLIKRTTDNNNELTGNTYNLGNTLTYKSTTTEAVYCRVYNSSRGNISIDMEISSSGIPGIWSNGYWDGSSFVSSGVWMIYRDTTGNMLVRSCSGTASTSLVNTSSTDGKRLSGAHCNTSTQLGLYGQWGTTGTTYAYRYVTVTTSDPRLKENIEPTKINALELINKINLYSFDWKNDDTPHYDVGYLATELYELDHNLAIKPDDETEGYWGVNDFYMSGVQTKAIQELSKENEELRRKIQSLERRISLVENAKNDVTH